MAEWQPIETVPRDGRKALLWCPKASADPISPWDWGPEIAIMDMPPDWWRQRGYTHWQPLLPPPAATDA